MMNLFEMLQAIFGKNIMSKTIGTRTNVIKFPSNKNNPLTTSFDVAKSAENPALIEKLKKIIEDEAPYIAKMNDSEKVIYEGNVRRLHDHLVSTGEIKPVVSAEVIGLGDKQPVTGKGLEDLIQKQGTQNPPTTVSGQVEQQGKKVEGLSEQLDKEFVKGKKRSVSDILDDYFSSYKDMKSVEDEGLVRAVARQIMYQDLNAGKLKVPKEVEETIRGMSSKDVLDDFSQWYGSAALEDLYQNADKFYKMSAPQDAVKFLKENKYSNWEKVYQPREKPIKEYMEPEEFKKMLSNSAYNRNGMFVPKGSEKLDEKTLKEIEDFYSKQKPKEIENEIRRMEEGHIFGEFQEEDKKTILQKLLELLKKTPPEAGIVGGIGVGTLANKATEDNGDKGLTYLTGGDNNYSMATGGRVGYQTGGPTNKILKYMIDTLVKEKDFNRQLLERSKPELVEGLFKQTYGKSAEEIADAVNKQLKGKSSMEVMNPKTGEITSPTEPVKTAEEPRTLGGLPIDERSANISDRLEEFSSTPITTLERRKQYLELRSEFIDSLDPRRKNKALDFQRKSMDTENRLILKAEEKGLDFDTFEKLRKGLYGNGKQKTLDFMKTGKVDLEPMKPATTFEEVQDRHRTAAKAADEIFPDYNDPKTAASELANVMAEQKHGKTFDSLTGDKQSDLYSEAYNYITSVNRLPKVSPANVPTEVLEHKMNEVLNSYDKSMFIKDKQGMVDVTHPENVAKMEELLRRDHPELHSQLKKLADDVGQKETLLDFDVTGRQPNAKGGIIRKKYGHEGAANPKKAQITAIYGEGTLPKDYSKGLGYLSGE